VGQDLRVPPIPSSLSSRSRSRGVQARVVKGIGRRLSCHQAFLAPYVGRRRNAQYRGSVVPSEPMRRHLFAALLLLTLAGLTWLAYRESGRERIVARAKGSLLSPPVGDGRAVAWIETRPESARVMLAGRWARPRELLSAGGLAALAMDAGKLVVARQKKEQEVELIAIDISSGRRQALTSVRGHIRQIVMADGVVAWLEERPAALPGVPFVAAAGPTMLIRALPRQSGPASLVARLVIDAVLTSERIQAAAWLLGMSDDRVFWLEHCGRDETEATVVRACPVTGGKAQTLALEPGTQQAVLLREAVVWTADSQEAALPKSFSAVKRGPLIGGNPQVIADWLGRGALLMGSKGRAYVQDKGLLWSLGTRRWEQRTIHARSGDIVAAQAIGDDQYLILRDSRGWLLAKRPLTLWARIRNLLRC